MKMSGNTVLITGGTSGIGLELATRLLALGNTVIVTGRDPSKLDAVKRTLPALHGVQSDVSDPKAIAGLHQHVLTEFPGLNVLVNNAGIMRRMNLRTPGSDLDDLTREIDINLSGPIRMSMQFLPHLLARDDGVIINVSSGLAFVPLPILPIYCATKAGIHSFTQSLRMQLQGTRVTVVELAPPLTRTHLLDIFDHAAERGPSMDLGKMVDAAMDGLKQGQPEIRPGLSNVLQLMSRVAPNLVLKQFSKRVGRMLAQRAA